MIRGLVHAEAAPRMQAALEFLRALPREGEVWVVAPSPLSLDALSRGLEGARVGWQRTTLGRLALRFAEPTLWADGRVVASRVLLQALVVRLCARHEDLGRFEPLRRTPGFPAALLDTLEELRFAGLDGHAELPPDLARLAAAYAHELDAERVADRPMVLDVATRALPATLGPLLMLDFVARGQLELRFARALLTRATSSLLTVPKGARLSEHLIEERMAPPALSSPLTGFADALFEERTAKVDEDAVAFVSAPGEAREALEIARAARRLAGEGIRFDRMAIVLRDPTRYAAHLEEAFGRADIPLHSRRGTRRPSPAGRAFVALLRTAREGLSARRFAEYLAFGQVPREQADGAPPSARGRFVPVDDEYARIGAELRVSPDSELDELPPLEPGAQVTGGGLRAPRAWERILVETAVLGTMDRWRRRLAGRAHELDDAIAEAEREEPERVDKLRSERALLEGLSRFAMPLLEQLAALPEGAGWSRWLVALRELAERALRRPDPVLMALSELEPLASLESGEPVSLDDVLLVLEPRITTFADHPGAPAAGAVLVASPDDLAGLDFDVVFVAGLAEKVFPARIAEDPLLLDTLRARIDDVLPQNAERAQLERFRLISAVGAARTRVVFSYPRLDVQASRPRTPSFYLLELWRAKNGTLPRAEELSRHAADALDARLGWPAPRDPEQALDDVEHDLGLLDRLLAAPEEESTGLARFLLGENPHLGRALRARAERWNKKKWYPSDGFVADSPESLAALAGHQPSARSFSPTALQHFSACPYRFYLQAVVRLAPREEPEPAYELNPLQRGSLVHQIQFELLLGLRDEGLLPLDPARTAEASALLEQTVERVTASKEDELAPAIPRVWEDQIAELRTDVREWFRRLTLQEEFRPEFFELAFGLPDHGEERDPRSQNEPVAIDAGLKLRGSIDLVEKNAQGVYRATDYKTGKVRAADGDVIKGGAILQPVMYALVLEKMLGEPGLPANVVGGQLSYCTYAGGFKDVPVELNDEARESAAQLGRALGGALQNGFLPALPRDGECKYCDYRSVCGPYEEIRAGLKPGNRPEKRVGKPLAANAPPQARMLYDLGLLRNRP